MDAPLFDVQLVSHCWAGDDPRYAEFLRVQIESLMHTPPKARTVLTVCCHKDDERVAAVLTDEVLGGWLEHVRIQVNHMTKSRLFRRAIGRDEAAREPIGRALWFTDCDYAFGEGAIDAVSEQVEEFTQLRYPQFVHRQEHPQLIGYDAEYRIKPSMFQRHQERKAIGGIQIIGASLAMELGYLPDMTEPYFPAIDGFGYFRDDANWRRYTQLPGNLVNEHDGGKNLGPGRGIEIPNVYRLRHGSNQE
jgi:hypothetical protein